VHQSSQNVIGLARGTVQVVPYQPAWASLFATEAELLRSIMGAAALRIEHIGSTALVGMDAKPIIDLMVAVENQTAAERWILVLAAHDYEFRPDLDIPDRIFFAKGPHSRRTHHLSLTEPTSDFFARHLLFVAYLRAHGEAFAAYRALKLELAQKFPREREAYTEGKREFIERVLALAAAEFDVTIL
jgi:GrpB-like predicted nucleotidyltransferase (UPF0157 family)